LIGDSRVAFPQELDCFIVRQTFVVYSLVADWLTHLFIAMQPILFAWYNFDRVLKAIKATPAMASVLVDQV
jgi:hypothetical protein